MPAVALAKVGSTSLSKDVDATLAWLKKHATRATLDGMARYAIPSDNALGVAMRDIKALGKQMGRRHDLTQALWDTGCYEARILISFIGDPQQLTIAEMNRWTREFDNWAICDSLCFHLFDRSPHAWNQIPKWASSKQEFVKRTAFALIWSLSVHDKKASDEQFLAVLPLIESAATDDRNFVKKSVSMALRATGKRNAALRKAALDLARRLVKSPDSTAAWIGKEAVRELAR